VSASTNASNRSSFAPEEPYRLRRFFHLPGTDHYHRQARRQQRINQHPVAPLDRDLGRAAAAQPGDQPGDPGPVMRGGKPVGHLAGQDCHAHGMIGRRPVDPGAHAAGRDFGQNPD